MKNTSGERKKLSTSVLFRYGVGAVGEGIGYNVFFSFFSYFLTVEAGIAPAIAGLISGVAVLWDAVTDPLIGSMSDKSRNPKGRRMPYIMSGSILFGLSIALLFFNWNLPGTLKVIYYIVINMVYWLALTTCVVPHISLGSELTEDFDERTKLRTWAVTLMNIGTLIAVGTPLLLVKAFTNIAGSSSAGWAAAGIIYGVLTALVYQICCRTLREPRNPNLDLPEEKGGVQAALKEFFGNAKVAFRNKALGKLIAVTFFLNIMVTFGTALAIYLLTFVFGFNEEQSSLVYTLQGVFVVITAVLVGYAAQKIGKKAAMSGGILFYIAGFLVIILLPVSWTSIIISIALYAFGNSGYWTMIYAMSYDAAIVEQLRSGEKPDGLYTSLIGLFMKFGNALGSVLCGVGLQLIGFVEGSDVQTASAVTGIRYLYALVPSAIMVVTLVFTLAYPLTREKYASLAAALEKKQRGEPVDPAILKPYIR